VRYKHTLFDIYQQVKKQIVLDLVIWYNEKNCRKNEYNNEKMIFMSKENLKKIINYDKWKDFLCVLSFAFAYLLLMGIITRGKYIFGSQTDFTTQHFYLPEYLRLLFYENGDFFPDFAFNLGAGTSIYSISYYGLLNPIVILSYLFPFIEMYTFLIGAMAVVVVSSASLFYFYLKKNGYGRPVSYICAFLFFFATPLTFHAHRHIMFVNYMPFLVMGLYGIDKYVYKKKSWLLILSVTLMIFTSYYFSVSGAVALFIFGCFKYVRENGFIFKNLFNYAVGLAIRFITAVLISAVLILPTFYNIFSGRSENVSSFSFWSLLIPRMDMLYSWYSMGLTMVALVAAVYMLFSKKIESKILSGILLAVSIFPIFNYALNGFLYINAKSLIPFIPLALVNTADYITLIKDKVRHKKIAIAYLLISAVVISGISHYFDDYIPRIVVNDSFHDEYKESVQKILSNDRSYRINHSSLGGVITNKVTDTGEYKTTIYSSAFNEDYRTIFRDLFENPIPHRNEFMINASNSPIFQSYMGEKYVYSYDEYDFFYEFAESYGDKKLYKNPYALPIGYATSNVINKNDFNKLEYPQNMLNMLGNAIIDQNTTAKLINATEISNLDYSVITKDNFKSKKTNGGYFVVTDKKCKATVELKEESLKGKLLLISFDLTPKDTDLHITINGVGNLLTDINWKYYNKNTTFVYTLVNSDNKLDITFEPGEYEIKNIKIHTFDHNILKGIKDSVDPFVIDGEKTKGDIISGKINVREDRYFMLSIPYDKGFDIKIDGKSVDYYKANEAFIGFDISKGEHRVDIEYTAPLKKEGTIASICGLLLLAGLIIFEGRRKNGKDNNNSTLL